MTKEAPKKMTKLQWSLDEDSILKDKVAELGDNQWKKIAKSIKGRVGKQCRERWLNHLSPHIKDGPWTEEEDAMLIEAHKEVGNKWSKIAKKLHGRPENSIKNRWNSVKRRRTTNHPDGSQLQAYIKEINGMTQEKEESEEEEEEEKAEEEEEAEEVAPEKGNLNLVGEANNMPLDHCDDDDISFMIRSVFPKFDFSSENWMFNLLNSPMDSDLNLLL